jgi:hypothetical protein
MVWIVDWSQPEQFDHKITAWATEQDALTQAAHDIMEEVFNWDLSDPDTEEVAKRINACVSTGDYRGALREFNDDQSDQGTDMAMYFHVYERAELIGAQRPNTILFNDDEEEEEESDDEEEETIPDTLWVASTPGATCRGPSCGTYNEYAYADKPDGTYCCHSCKMMMQVFGGKTP